MSFVLPVLEYCSAVWCSAADSHLKLLDRFVMSAGFLAGGVLDCNLARRQSVAELCMLSRLRVIQCILWEVHCLCRMCRHVLLMVLWLLIGTRSRLLVVGLLSFAKPVCPSRYLFGTILVTLCSMVWDWRVSRVKPMLPGWHDLLFLWCLLLFYLLLPSMSWLCRVGAFGLIECSHSLPALHSGLQIIIIACIFLVDHSVNFWGHWPHFFLLNFGLWDDMLICVDCDIHWCYFWHDRRRQFTARLLKLVKQPSCWGRSLPQLISSASPWATCRQVRSDFIWAGIGFVSLATIVGHFLKLN